MNCMMQQCVYIVLLLIGRDFKCSCAQIHRPIQTHLEYIVSRNETIYMSNGYFTPDANGYLGEGNYWIAWQGKNHILKKKSKEENVQLCSYLGTFSANNCERPIAMKFGIDRKAYYREYEIVAALKSAYNETAENYRIPSLYSHGFALERYWAMGTTLCDETIEQAISIYGPLSPANLLRVFYHAVRIVYVSQMTFIFRFLLRISFCLVIIFFLKRKTILTGCCIRPSSSLWRNSSRCGTIKFCI